MRVIITIDPNDHQDDHVRDRQHPAPVVALRREP